MMRLMPFLFVLVFTVSWSHSAWALCVDKEFVNLRGGPSTNHARTWKVYRYMPLEKIRKEGGWYLVRDVDSDKHWIREDLVTSSYKCAVIKNKYANLRTGPGTNFSFAIPERGDKYLSFRVLKKKSPWLQVEDIGGDEAWIHSKLVWVK